MLKNIVDTLNKIKRVAKIILGTIIILIGIILLPLPGPGWLIIFLGLVILATELKWAKNLLNKLKIKYKNLKKSIKKSN